MKDDLAVLRLLLRPRFASAGDRQVSLYDMGANDPLDPFLTDAENLTELLNRDDARRSVIAIEEVIGVARGRVRNGMRTLVHKQRVYSVTVGALEPALQILLIYLDAVTSIASLGTRIVSLS